MYVTASGVLAELVMVCAGMLSFPFVAKPDNPFGALAVQEMETPSVVEVMITGWEERPEQMVCGAGVKSTVGLG